VPQWLKKLEDSRKDPLGKESFLEALKELKNEVSNNEPKLNDEKGQREGGELVSNEQMTEEAIIVNPAMKTSIKHCLALDCVKTFENESQLKIHIDSEHSFVRLMADFMVSL
jgi:hypothetical protein